MRRQAKNISITIKGEEERGGEEWRSGGVEEWSRGGGERGKEGKRSKGRISEIWTRTSFARVKGLMGMASPCAPTPPPRDGR